MFIGKLLKKRYFVMDKIGKGAFGVVYRVQDQCMENVKFENYSTKNNSN